MTKATDFFSEEQQNAILASIAAAERMTSGEIRVHLEETCSGDAYERAVQLFGKLGMTETRERNGILFYLAVGSHKFAIAGDKGIHEKVGEEFWSSVAHEMESNFRQGKFTEGLCRAIEEAGAQLQKHFPFTHDDTNELTDQISTS